MSMPQDAEAQKRKKKPDDLGEWIVDTITEYQSQTVAKQTEHEYPYLRYWDPALPSPRGEVQDPLCLFRQKTENMPEEASDTQYVYLVKDAASDFISNYRGKNDDATAADLAHVFNRDPRTKAEPVYLETVPLGLVDEPEQQRWRTMLINLLGDPNNVASSGGPLLIVGSQGAGKRTALRTLMLWLALRVTPGQLYCAVIDPDGALEEFEDLTIFQTDRGESLYTQSNTQEDVKVVLDRFDVILKRQLEQLEGFQGLYRNLTKHPSLCLLIVTQYSRLVTENSGTLKLITEAFNEVWKSRQVASAIFTSSAYWRPSATALDIGAFRNRIVLDADENTRSAMLPRQYAKQATEIEGRGYAVMTREKPLAVQIALPVRGVGEQAQREAVRSLLALASGATRS